MVENVEWRAGGEWGECERRVRGARGCHFYYIIKIFLWQVRGVSECDEVGAVRVLCVRFWEPGKICSVGAE